MAQVSRTGSREWCHDRLHHRSNHLAKEQELQDTKPSALDCTFTEDNNIQHDLPDFLGSVDRFSSEESRGILEAANILSHMSTPENVARAGVLLPLGKKLELVECMKEDKSQLDDMQAPIANAQTLVSDQESEVFSTIWSSPSKRRKIVYLADGLGRNITKYTKSTLSESELKTEAQNPEACEDSGLTAEHMADLDSSKSSTLEDIDSAARVSACLDTSEGPPRCILGKRVGEYVEQASERRQLNLHLSPRQNTSQPSQGTSPGCDDTQSTSQFLPPIGRTYIDSQDIESNKNTDTESIIQMPPKSKPVISGPDKWLQLSLGSRQSDESPDNAAVRELDGPRLSPMRNPPSGISEVPQQPSNALVDFFNFQSAENVGTLRHYNDVHGSTPSRISSSPHKAQPAAAFNRSGGESSRPYSSIPTSSYRPVSSSFFLDTRSRDLSRADLNVHVPRVAQPNSGQSPTQHPGGNSESQFLSPSPILQKAYAQPANSYLTSLPYHSTRVLQPVRSQQTETTSVNISRSRQTTNADTGLRSVSYVKESQTWLQQPNASSVPPPWIQSHHDPPRTPPNPIDPLNTMTPTEIRDWKPLTSGDAASSSFWSMQPPSARGVDHEQAWRNLLQRVGSNLNMPSGFRPSCSIQRPGADSKMPPSDPQEYLDALKRAAERFQGPHQGPKGESLTDLQLFQRSSMFPPARRGSQLGLPSEANTDISLANTPSSSGIEARGAASFSERQRRILRPSAPKSGLWFTLQLASNSKPEASPLQQIPTAYIRVLDGNMTVAAVKKYLMNKLGLSSEDEVELTCKGQPLVPSIPLSQVRDGIWQAPNTNTTNPETSQLLSEGKAWKSPADGSVTLVGDVVMVLTYGRRPQGASTST